jgi:Domain of unknown function (DUF397)
MPLSCQDCDRASWHHTIASFTDHGFVLVRDTTNRVGAVLTIPAEAWQIFASSLK